jgi:hypothetical protein
MANTLQDASPLLKTMVIGALIVGVVFGGIGVWLAFLGATGETEVNFLGQSFKSLNVGIASVFIGGVIAAMTLRRAFRTIELGMNQAAADASTPRVGRAVSGKQRELLHAIAAAGTEGIYACHFDSSLSLDREAIVYRARDLESQGYITVEPLTDYLYRITHKGLQELGMS